MKDRGLQIAIPSRMLILLVFGTQYYFQTRFFLASISCIFYLLYLRIETLVN